MRNNFIDVLIVAVAICSTSLGVNAQTKASGSTSYKLGEKLKPSDKTASADSNYEEIKWEALVPKEWDPMKDFKSMDMSKLQDGDPKAMDMLDKLRFEWDNAPAEPSMNNKKVRLPGFVVPLDKQGELVKEFLLVPYFGACIHSPPPPANQIVHVIASTPVKMRTMDTMWVNGMLKITRSDTTMGKSGYQMKSDSVAPYKAPEK
jgi:hypothetical protein